MSTAGRTGVRGSSVLGISSWFPIMCKWNVFTIDSPYPLCDDGPADKWENFCHLAGGPRNGIEMSVDTGTSSVADDRSAPERRPMSPERSSDTLPVSLVHGLLDAVNS